MSTVNIEGGCYCGAIRYRAATKPIASMICHCQSCRRIAGSPVVAWVTFPRAQFQLTRGQPAQFDSSTQARRTFCPSCGTPLTYEGKRWPDEVDVTTCTLDAPDAYPPTHHSWYSHKLSWIRFGDGLPAFPETRDEGT